MIQYNRIATYLPTYLIKMYHNYPIVKERIYHQSFEVLQSQWTFSILSVVADCGLKEE